LFFADLKKKSQYSELRAEEMQLSHLVTNVFTLRHERTLSEARRTKLLTILLYSDVLEFYDSSVDISKTVVEIYQVVALGMDSKTVGCAFIECALPPVGEVVERIDESFSVEAGCSE
jgi:hypothetical protein